MNTQLLLVCAIVLALSCSCAYAVPGDFKEHLRGTGHVVGGVDCSGFGDPNIGIWGRVKHLINLRGGRILVQLNNNHFRVMIGPHGGKDRGCTRELTHNGGAISVPNVIAMLHDPLNDNQVLLVLRNGHIDRLDVSVVDWNTNFGAAITVPPVTNVYAGAGILGGVGNTYISADSGPDGSIYMLNTGNFVTKLVHTQQGGQNEWAVSAVKFVRPGSNGLSVGNMVGGIAVDHDTGRIYVGSSINDIKVYTKWGMPVNVDSCTLGNIAGVGAPGFCTPSRLKFGPDRALYVVCTGPNVQRIVFTNSGVLNAGVAGANGRSVAATGDKLDFSSGGDIAFSPEYNLLYTGNGNSNGHLQAWEMHPPAPVNMVRPQALPGRAGKSLHFCQGEHAHVTGVLQQGHLASYFLRFSAEAWHAAGYKEIDSKTIKNLNKVGGVPMPPIDLHFNDENGFGDQHIPNRGSLEVTLSLAYSKLRVHMPENQSGQTSVKITVYRANHPFCAGGKKRYEPIPANVPLALPLDLPDYREDKCGRYDKFLECGAGTSGGACRFCHTGVNPDWVGSACEAVPLVPGPCANGGTQMSEVFAPPDPNNINPDSWADPQKRQSAIGGYYCGSHDHYVLSMTYVPKPCSPLSPCSLNGKTLVERRSHPLTLHGLWPGRKDVPMYASVGGGARVARSFKKILAGHLGHGAGVTEADVFTGMGGGVTDLNTDIVLTPEMVDSMKLKWPSLFGNSYQGFWRHEFVDHANGMMCTGDYPNNPPRQAMRDYAWTTLAIYNYFEPKLRTAFYGVNTQGVFDTKNEPGVTFSIYNAADGGNKAHGSYFTAKIRLDHFIKQLGERVCQLWECQYDDIDRIASNSGSCKYIRDIALQGNPDLEGSNLPRLFEAFPSLRSIGITRCNKLNKEAVENALDNGYNIVYDRTYCYD